MIDIDVIKTWHRKLLLEQADQPMSIHPRDTEIRYVGILLGKIDGLHHEIADRDLAREIQRDIWAKEVELSALRTQLSNAWGKLR